jgi:predicted RNA-binding protein
VSSGWGKKREQRGWITRTRERGKEADFGKSPGNREEAGWGNKEGVMKVREETTGVIGADILEEGRKMRGERNEIGPDLL